LAQGIYWVLNRVNGKMYVGSAVDSNRRWSEHRSDLRRSVHINSYLQRAVNKYGLDNFVIEMIEEVEDELWLPVRETAWIRKLRSNDSEFGYNQTDHGFRSNDQTGLKRSAESKARMSRGHEGRKARGDYRKFTEEDHRKARAISSEVLRAAWKDPEWKAKTSAALSAGWTPEARARKSAQAREQQLNLSDQRREEHSKRMTLWWEERKQKERAAKLAAGQE
jgi:group I intron endonuclease